MTAPGSGRIRPCRPQADRPNSSCTWGTRACRRSARDRKIQFCAGRSMRTDLTGSWHNCCSTACLSIPVHLICVFPVLYPAARKTSSRQSVTAFVATRSQNTRSCSDENDRRLEFQQQFLKLNAREHVHIIERLVPDKQVRRFRTGFAPAEPFSSARRKSPPCPFQTAPVQSPACARSP